jgi:acetoacetyl-CoA reductase
MSKSVPELALQNMWLDLTGYLHNTQNHMFRLHNPLEFTFDSIFRLSEFAGHTFDQLVRHQTDALDFYLPAQAEQKTAGTSRHTVAVKPARIETGYVAVVTGGTGGIGSEICKRLYTDGHQVIATHIAYEKDLAKTWQAERRKEGYEIDIIECDVTDFESCQKMGKKLESVYHRIDILVNCAGITRDATLRKMEPDKWHAVLDTNLDSVFNVTRNFIDGMIRRGYGRIINISSVNGQKGQFGQTNYSTAKAGIIGFSKALALELADTGITVNSVCPGYVGTSMVETIPEDIKNSIIAKIPMKRLARPAEIAAAVAFLAEENSGYITGSEISINGGLFTGVS